MAAEELVLVFREVGGKVVAAEARAVNDETSNYSSTADKAAESSGRLKGAFGSLFKVIGMGVGLLGVAGLGLGLKDLISTAQAAQAANANLGNAVKAMGIYTRGATGAMIKYSESMSEKGGFAAPAATQALSNFVRVTGSVAESEKDLSLATDIARGKHLQLTQVTKALMMVEQGRITGLTRMGIIIPKTATATQAMAILQGRFAGATKAYSDTAVGAMANMGHVIENVADVFLKKLWPDVNKVADAVSKFVSQIQRGTGAGGKFRDVAESIGKKLLDLAKFLWSIKNVLVVLLIAWAAYAAAMKVQALWQMVLKTEFATSGALLGLLTGEITLAQGACWLLNAAFEALDAVNPFFWIVAAVVLLVILYDKVGWFRDLVKAAFGIIVDVFKDVWTAIKFYFGLIWFIFANFTPWGLIITHLGMIVGFVEGLGKGLARAFVAVFDAAKSAIETGLNALIKLWNAIPWIHSKHSVLGIEVWPGIPKIGLLGGGGGGASSGSAAAAGSAASSQNTLIDKLMAQIANPRTTSKVKAQDRDTIAGLKSTTDDLAGEVKIHNHVYIDGREVAIAITRQSNISKSKQ
jgi:hypothetical protein